MPFQVDSEHSLRTIK